MLEHIIISGGLHHSKRQERIARRNASVDTFFFKFGRFLEVDRCFGGGAVEQGRIQSYCGSTQGRV